MKRVLLITAITGIAIMAYSQDITDVSLFLRSDSTVYLDEVRSETGDLYSEVGHHGPAVENVWIGFRIYFDHKCAIDIYNKSRAGLELKEARWYPDANHQKQGWGADYYKVGSTVGLGGVRLWDGEKVIKLDPVRQRIARVHKGKDMSWAEMISEGVSYMGRKVDILIRIKVFPGTRMATVEAEALKGGPVRFVTGINYHPGQQVKKHDGLIASWGEHPEDVAAEKVEIGGALLYDPEDFEKMMDDGSQYLLISTVRTSLATRITSACAREPELNTMESFLSFLEKSQ